MYIYYFVKSFMTQKELLQYIKENITINPSGFCNLTLKEVYNLQIETEQMERHKKAENKKRQIFEALLKKKQRQLLVL